MAEASYYSAAISTADENSSDQEWMRDFNTRCGELIPVE